MNNIIKVENLGKRYHIGGTQDRHPQFRDVMISSLLGPIRRLFKRESASSKEKNVIWALRDVGFSVQQGEVMGIIGPNGAGKTTLLKILSRITVPTEGEAVIKGRVGSLLEVGTGFHPEMTGRENIYLNGGILGLKREEIRRRFDEIVNFSGIGRFIDTPVKRYSSGMYVRLAFSVAAHLETEVLIVDEVLAVGDISFQQKCLQKMHTVAGAGRTVIFVSHNLHAVKSLCTRAILIDQGRLIMDGGVDEVVSRYLADIDGPSTDGLIPADKPRVGTGEAILEEVRLLNRQGQEVDKLHIAEPFTLRMTFNIRRPLDDALIEVGISSIDDVRLLTVFNTDNLQKPFNLKPGRIRIEVNIDANLLPNHYAVDIGIIHFRTGQSLDFLRRTIEFSVLNIAPPGQDNWRWSVAVRGFVRPENSWSDPFPL